MLLSELASTLTLFDVEPNRLVAQQTVSTLPQGITCDNLGGHLALNAAGDRVYASNRRHDSISVFALDATELKLLHTVQTGGRSPRHFLLREDMSELLVAHEESGSISRLSLHDGGLPHEPADVIDIAGAAFLLEV